MNKSKIYAAVALVLIVGVVAGFFWLLYLKNQNSEFAQNLRENQGAVDVSSWKTYRNEQYGFEVKYPENWRVDEQYEPILLRSLVDKRQEIGFWVTEDLVTVPVLADWIKNHTPWVKDFDSEFTLYQVTPSVFAYQNIQTGTVFFQRGGNVFWVENGLSIERKVVNSKLFDQILSTFKFTK